MRTIATPRREHTSPGGEELLIKEARRRARLRRTITTVIVGLLVASVGGWLASGGARTPPLARHVGGGARSAGTTSGARSGATPAVLGGQSVTTVGPVGHDTLWVATQNVTALHGGGQGIELTTNGGRTWTNATPGGLARDGGTHWIGGLFALSPKRAWITVGGVSGGSQTIEATGDAGRNWTAVGTLPAHYCTLQFVSPTNGTCTDGVGAAGSMPIALYRTSDGGATWHKVYDDTAVALSGTATPAGDLPFMCDKSLDFSSVNTGWALFYCSDSDPVLYRTANGGRTWMASTVVQPRPLVVGGAGFTGTPAFVEQRGALGFTGGDYSLVYVTSDGGKSFYPVYPPLSHQWSVDVITPSIWRLVYRTEILATNDAGRSWFSIASNAFAPVAHLRYGPSAPWRVAFSSTTNGWLTWFTANGYLVMHTADGGYHWRVVRVPGTQRS